MTQDTAANPHGESRVIDLSQILLALHEAPDSEETVQRVAESSVSAVACDDAGVLLVHARNRVETAAATSQPVARAHELQVELDEGPCLDALENPGVYSITDTEADERWPRWSAEVTKLGYRSVLSVPLATQARRFGSLNVYAARPDAFDDDDLAVTSILARHASVSLASSRDVEGLRKAVDARKLIGMAMGLLMERYDVEPDPAFEVLRRYSQDHNIKLRDVARQIVEHRTLPGAS
ncbi:GAF and ANTAR domain-containing protein [Aeromicrobium alkaliterrae]|uniref:GAF and ANTAR domain-containing protein n=1 Tax=Aeromicrobium alkaliterrae TaxID=302168 RepID=A0ABP4W7T0_9ACTN